MDLEKLKVYNRNYYLKTRDTRREKIKCEFCQRQVCKEYYKKHLKKSICQKAQSGGDNAFQKSVSKTGVKGDTSPTPLTPTASGIAEKLISNDIA